MIKATDKTARDSSIDILRSFAIIGIIIAHSNPMQEIIQFRGFDVILMVFLSGVCTKGFDKEGFKPGVFYLKRFFRLIAPVWIFLMAYFIGCYFLGFLPSKQEIASRFSLTSNWYVWIIRILFLLAIIAPYMWRYSLKLSSRKLLFVFCIGMILCEVLFLANTNTTINLIIMTIPYGLVFLLGMNISKFSNIQILTLAMTLLLVFLLFGTCLFIQERELITTSSYKYPPRIYYVSYGLGCTLVLWKFKKSIEIILDKLALKNSFVFIGKNTFWIYLLHIPFVDCVGDNFNFPIRFIIIFGAALCCVFTKNVLLQLINSRSSFVQVFKG